MMTSDNERELHEVANCVTQDILRSAWKHVKDHKVPKAVRLYVLTAALERCRARLLVNQGLISADPN